MRTTRGYTLVELMIAIGLFAIIMMLVSGSYLIMINVSRQAQGIATGVNTLSFALETMVRTIRTSTDYGCPTAFTDCPNGSNSTFSVRDQNGNTVSYTRSAGGAITQTINGGTAVPLTDSSINITSLQFYAVGTSPYSVGGDSTQARVTIVMSGTVSSGQGTPFVVETSATMRGSDI